TSSVPTYEQPFQMNYIAPQNRVAKLDVLATRSDDAVSLHVITRRFGQSLPLTVDLEAVGQVAPDDTHHLLEGSLRNEPIEAGSPEVARVRRLPLRVSSTTIPIDLPPRSVSIIEFQLDRAGAGAGAE